MLPKLNWSSPRDAAWMGFARTLKCTTLTDIFTLLKSSEFVCHDLSMPYQHCVDEGSRQGRKVLYVLVLRYLQCLCSPVRHLAMTCLICSLTCSDVGVTQSTVATSSDVSSKTVSWSESANATRPSTTTTLPLTRSPLSTMSGLSSASSSRTGSSLRATSSTS